MERGGRSRSRGGRERRDERGGRSRTRSVSVTPRRGRRGGGSGSLLGSLPDAARTEALAIAKQRRVAMRSREIHGFLVEQGRRGPRTDEQGNQKQRGSFTRQLLCARPTCARPTRISGFWTLSNSVSTAMQVGELL